MHLISDLQIRQYHGVPGGDGKIQGLRKTVGSQRNECVSHNIHQIVPEVYLAFTLQGTPIYLRNITERYSFDMQSNVDYTSGRDFRAGF